MNGRRQRSRTGWALPPEGKAPDRRRPRGAGGETHSTQAWADRVAMSSFRPGPMVEDSDTFSM